MSMTDDGGGFNVDDLSGLDFEDPFEVEFDEEAANSAYAEWERLLADTGDDDAEDEMMESSDIPVEPQET